MILLKYGTSCRLVSLILYQFPDDISILSLNGYYLVYAASRKLQIRVP